MSTATFRRSVAGLAAAVVLLQAAGLAAVERLPGPPAVSVRASGPGGGDDGNPVGSAPCVPPEGQPARFSPGPPQGDGTCLAPFEELPGGVKEFHLRAAPVAWEVAPGDVKEAFAFNGTIPGPTIRVTEGDRVRVVVQNDLPEETVVHWHGMVLPIGQDGVPGVTQPPIPPGGAYTYEYTAVSTGTHWYHPHFTGDQVGKGLYGSLEVVPRTGDRPVDRDYRLFVGDTNLGLVFNGKSFPATAPFRANVGEYVRIRITSTGEMEHPLHLHGQPFRLVAQDGFDLPQPVTMDTLLVGTAQTFDIVTTILGAGRWLFHCHIFSHMHSGEHHDMTGLVTVVDAAPAGLPVPPVAPPSPLADSRKTDVVPPKSGLKHPATLPA